MISLGPQDTLYIRTPEKVFYTITGKVITGVSLNPKVLSQGQAKGSKSIVLSEPVEINNISVTASLDTDVSFYINGLSVNNKIYQATLSEGYTLSYTGSGWKIYDNLGLDNSFGIINSVVTTTGNQTLTNKRIVNRIGTTVSSSSPTINSDLYDFYSITAQAADITSINITGTPIEGQTIWIAITTTGSKNISFGSQFEASSVALPTSITGATRLDVGFVYSTTTGKWRITGMV